MKEKESCCCCCGHEQEHDHKHEHDEREHEHNEDGCGCDHDHREDSCGCGHDHDHEDSCGCGCGCGHDHEHGGTIEKRELVRLGVALALFFAGMLLPVPDLAQRLLLAAAYLVSGYEVLLHAGKNILKGRVFDENFLMSVASLGACLIGDWAEGAAVMLFYNIGELVQSYAVGRSRGSIAALMDIRPDTATVIRDGIETLVSAQSVEVGECIVVRAGELIPLDGRIAEGSSQLDTAALTGESLPRDVAVGDPVLAGCVNLSGVLKVKVTKPFGESTASKILELTEKASSNKAETERFITRFARYYTPAVVGLAVAIAILPPLLGFGAWSDYIHRALTFLVISCPCALVISVPMGFFAGIGCASRNGILVKGGNYLEALCQVHTVVFDKTGTLTRGKFEVLGIQSEGMEAEELLALAALAERYSTHPIAQSLREAAPYVDHGRLGQVRELAGYGVEAAVDGRAVLVGNARLMERFDISVPSAEQGGTTVFVAVDGQFRGSVLIGDALKPEAGASIRALKELGVANVVMLTGDHSQAAAQIAGEVGVDQFHADLLPGDKVEKVEQLLERKGSKGKLLFIGDGMNDAPVLARADIGVAMGGMGSDAAIEAADMVIMDDDLARLPTAIRVARRTQSIVIQNVVFSLGVKLIVLTLGGFGHASMWAAVFADVGVCVLAVLNAMRALRLRN